MFSAIYFCFMSLEPGAGFLNLLNPQKPGNLTKPLPAKTPTLVGRCGFAWVRVQVALENPRVTRDNH